jgi:hypothetical protein
MSPTRCPDPLLRRALRLLVAFTAAMILMSVWLELAAIITMTP